jgi:hypothetical protein
VTTSFQKGLCSLELSTDKLLLTHSYSSGAGVALSVQSLTIDWMTGLRSPAETKDASLSRPTLGPTQPPVQWVPGGARPGRDANHSSHPVTRSRMSRSYTSLGDCMA